MKLTNEDIKAANLTPEEEKVLRMRYGIAPDPQDSLGHREDPSLQLAEARVRAQLKRN